MAQVSTRRLPPIARALAIVAVLTACNLLFNLVARGVGWGFPYSTFLSDPIDNFGDFFSLLASYPHGEWSIVRDGIGLHAIVPADPPSRHLFHLPGLAPVSNLHMMPLSTLAAMAAVALTQWIDSVVLFLLLLLALLGYLAAIAFRHAPSRRDAVLWTLLGAISYPMLVMAVRGNLFAALTALLAIHALLLGLQRRAPILAALLLAIACNLRPNAIIFALSLLLFYWPVRIRFALALGTFGLLILAISFPLATWLYPPFTFASFRAGLDAYYQLYAVRYFGLAYGSSLFGALKVLGGWRPGIDGGAMLASAALALAAAAAHVTRRLGDGGLLFVVTCAYALGTTIFGDYHLIIFLIMPIALAITAARSEDADTAPIMLLAAALVLAPKNYMFWFDRVSLQVLLNPLILLCVSLAVLARAWTPRRATAA